jgi:putative spermidine/putrescine transport system substrate-binding protein
MSIRMKSSRTHRPSRREFLRLGAAGALAAPAVWASTRAWAAGEFAGQTLRVLTWTDESGQAAVNNIMKPFEAETGAKIIADLTGATSEMVAKIKASASNPQYDLVILSGVGAIGLADEGLLEKPDPAKIPNLEKVAPDLRFAGDGAAIGYLLSTEGLMYSTARVDPAPTSWKTLWDEKYSGRLFLPPPQWIEAMELTLVAIQLAGATIQNPEPGFDLLEQLKDRVLTLGENPPQIAELFRSGSLDVGGPTSPLYFPTTMRDPAYGFNIAFDLEEGFYYDPQFMIIPKGHPGSSEAVYALINYALDAGVQAKMAEAVSYGTLNQDVVLPPEVLSRPGVVSPEVLKAKGHSIGTPELAAVRADWIQRYTEIFGM